MKKVIILRGLPGSGKSTLSKQLEHEIKSSGGSVAIVSSDQYFYQLGGGKYKFDPAHIGAAHASCFRKFIEELTKGTDLIIVDNTSTSTIEVAPYKLGADAFNYQTEIKQIISDPQDALKYNLHKVPETAIEAMHKSLQDPIPPWWSQEKIKSKTSDSGEPIFEKEEEEKLAQLSFKILKISRIFERNVFNKQNS